MKIKTIREFLTVEAKKDLRSITSMLLNTQIHGYIRWTGYGNLGDEAVYMGYQKLFPESNLAEVRVSRPVKFFSSILKRKPFEYVALGGGTLINQSKLWLKQSQYFIERDIPMFCLGTGVASREFWENHEYIHTANDIEDWSYLLKKFIYVGVRGPRSQKKLKDVGLQVDIVGDIAISLAPENYIIRKNRKIIGINISPATDNVMWGDSAELIQTIIKTVKSFLQEGFEVRLLPIWKDDLQVSNQIKDQFKDNNHCSVIVAYDSVENYLNEIEKCDLFIGLKLHATIFATMLRIPSIMLEYRPKCLDYMQSINMEAYSLRTDSVTPEILLIKMQDLITNYDSIVSTLNERILYYKHLQEEKSAFIKTALREK